MSSQQSPAGAGTSQGDIFEQLARQHKKTVGLVLGVLAALSAVIPIVAWSLHRWDAVAVIIWGILLVVTFALGSALSLSTARPGSSLNEADRLRLAFLVILAGLGLTTAGLGLVLPFSTPHYRDVFSGGLTAWRENPWMLARVAAAFLGGLLLTFVGLQLARTWERRSTAMRRLLYGYNAYLSINLVLFILLLINVLSYAPVKPFNLFAQTSDWTQSRIYSLSDSSKNFLRDLKEPVKVYVLLGGNDRIASEVETLLNNCRAINPRITWEMLSRDLNQQEVMDLITKYKLPDPIGLLVVYGTEPNVTHEFIKRSDLWSEPRQSMMRGERDQTERFTFKGESALLKALRYLAEGKSRATVYFAQGHGELDFGGRNPMQRDQGGWGVGLLREELEKRNYQTRALAVDRDLKQVPEDADVLVIAGPTQKWPDNGVKALRDYLQGTGRKKPGKAIVCLGLVGGGSAMEQVGIEPVLAEYNVRVGNERLLAVDPLINPPSPTRILALTNPNSTNVVARAFFQRERSPTMFILEDARSVTPAPANPNEPGRWNVEPLLVAVGDQLVVGEANLQASAGDVVRDLRRNLDQLKKRLLPAPVSVGVVVSESKSNMPRDMAHAGLSQEGEPRLVVVGSARWLADPMMGNRFGVAHVDLIASCLSWLRGQSDIGSGPEDTDKERVAYQPSIAPGSSARVYFLPGILLLLVVLTMGLGVWVVRRR